MEFTKLELLTAVGTLVAVISALWIMLKESAKRDAARLEKYEDLNENNQKQIVDLTGDYRELKGRIDSIESLSASVLGEIEKLRYK